MPEGEKLLRETGEPPPAGRQQMICQGGFHYFLDETHGDNG